jgi:16S rRNA (cytosine967-C5)-methyltransferase
MIGRARIAAYEILAAVSAGRADLPAAIAYLRPTLADERDRALASEISTGVLRWRLALDHLIAARAGRPIAKLDAEVVEILRIGVYQLLHLSRVPASAVVDDAVKMTRKMGKGSASGFVNAVLRGVSRTRGALPLPPRPESPDDRGAALDYLSITLSHPRWLAARWLDRSGFTVAEQWMTFNNQPAPLTLRANRLRTSTTDLQARLATAGVTTHPGRFAPEALIVDEGHALRTDEAAEGTFLVQDEASQLVALLAGARPGRRVLDTCAAPGGKTTAIAAATADDGHVVACDVRDRRMALLQQTVHAVGATNVQFVQADLMQALPFSAVFDTVLVDAPCSGLGTLRRDPDIKWRRQEAELPALAAAQTRMLHHAAAVVAPGGRLIYATCSSEPEENDQIVDAFLREHPAFVTIDARQTHPALPGTVVDAGGRLRTSPDQHDLESFFGAVFERAAHL